MEKIKERVIVLAKSLVGKAQMKYGALIEEAPKTFDCCGLTMWVYRENGIFIPREIPRQFERCKEIPLREISEGDLIFTTGAHYHFRKEQVPPYMGHVLLVVDDNSVVCATNSELGEGVVQIGLDRLFKTRLFLGAGRIIGINKAQRF